MIPYAPRTMLRAAPAVTLLLCLLLHPGAAAGAAAQAAAQAAAPAPTAPAAADQVQVVLAAIRQATQGMTTLRIPFVQEKHLAIMDQPITSEGAIEIDRTLGAVRWEFTGKSVMLFAKGHIRRWDADGKTETVASDPNLRAFQDQMQAFVSGDWSSLNQAFVLSSKDHDPLLILTPRTASLAKYLSRIEIHFRADYQAPQTLTMTATGGDETIYRFGEPQAGVHFAAGRFEHP